MITFWSMLFTIMPSSPPRSLAISCRRTSGAARSFRFGDELDGREQVRDGREQVRAAHVTADRDLEEVVVATV